MSQMGEKRLQLLSVFQNRKSGNNDLSTNPVEYETQCFDHLDVTAAIPVAAEAASRRAPPLSEFPASLLATKKPPPRSHSVEVQVNSTPSHPPANDISPAPVIPLTITSREATYVSHTSQRSTWQTTIRSKMRDIENQVREELDQTSSRVLRSTSHLDATAVPIAAAPSRQAPPTLQFYENQSSLEVDHLPRIPRAYPEMVNSTPATSEVEMQPVYTGPYHSPERPCPLFPTSVEKMEEPPIGNMRLTEEEYKSIMKMRGTQQPQGTFLGGSPPGGGSTNTETMRMTMEERKAAMEALEFSLSI
eukprot:CAMPEP_0198695366 /NCGR_PEP_ID=MMETSP1468-20131203/286275_1 /TAXON_ID=1461545 /ORGANISM="Mantoniella sp, Strain CCMP1436" /LENGTH=303 /DNA_ID=CAMNT_0044451037 /DNA_START=80 /DNA_END=992 /DNA_ORIENTATION=-